MSHFSVLVITDEEPDHDVLAAVLQPFHEYECTGVEDQYVVDVDVTEEVLSGYAKATETRLRDPDGALHNRFDESGNWKPEFSQPGDYGQRRELIPDGWTSVEIPTSDVEDIETWAKDYGGWFKRDGRFYDRTNPNKKWDWWAVGGRYNGRLLTVAGDGMKGEGGLMTPVKATGFDAVRRDNLDFAAMKLARQAERQKWLDEVVAKAKLEPGEIDAAFAAVARYQAEWQTLPHPRPRGSEYYAWMRSHSHDGDLAARLSEPNFELPDVTTTTAEWVSAAPSITAFAVLKDGEWTERGSMGWWGMVADEKDRNEWEPAVSALVDTLPGERWITVVDCHI